MTQPFTEDDFHDLLELETVLEELSESPGWQALRDEVERTMEFDRKRLLGGEVSDHDEYLKVAWRLRGAEAVFGAPQDVAKRVREYRKQMAERGHETELPL